MNKIIITLIIVAFFMGCIPNPLVTDTDKPEDVFIGSKQNYQDNNRIYSGKLLENSSQEGWKIPIDLFTPDSSRIFVGIGFGEELYTYLDQGSNFVLEGTDIRVSYDEDIINYNYKIIVQRKDN